MDIRFGSLLIGLSLGLLLPFLVGTTQTSDPWMVCPGPIPPPAANWPDSLPRILYLNNDDLCSTFNGLSLGNLGGYCSGPDAQPIFDYFLADRDLWSATIPLAAEYGSQIHNFHTWCFAACDCKDETTANAIRHESNYLQPSGSRGWAGMPGEGIYWNPQQVAAAGGPWGVGSDTPVPASTTTNATSAGELPACGANCTFPSQCDGDCSCQAQSSQFIPGSGTTTFLASCIVPGSGRKRDESLPCPCNHTYVSFGCCDSPDGRIWEAPEANLGVLAEVWEL